MERLPIAAAAVTAAAPSSEPATGLSRRRASRDLLWAVGAGCLPAAITSALSSPLYFHRRWLSDVGLVAFENLLLGLELAVCVALLKRRGFDPRAAWGVREHRGFDLFGGVLLGCVIVSIHWAVWVTMTTLGVREAQLPTYPSSNLWLEVTLLMIPAVGLAAWQGSLVLYGFVLDRALVVTGSRIAAVAIAAGLAVLTWASFAFESGRIITALVGTLMATASLVYRRVRPIVVAAVFGHLAVWVPLLLTRR